VELTYYSNPNHGQSSYGLGELLSLSFKTLSEVLNVGSVKLFSHGILGSPWLGQRLEDLSGSSQSMAATIAHFGTANLQ
jgi:hypothetical protein